MSNYIVFKVSLDGNTHRFSLEKEGLTIEKLNDALVSIFGKALLRYNLKYEDNDGDIITLKSNFDLKEAINLFSYSNKAVIRLQLTPKQPRRVFRKVSFNDEEEKERYSSEEGNQCNDDIINKKDVRFEDFRKFGEKFEAHIKEFLECLNNGEAKKWIDSLPRRRFVRRFLKRLGIPHHPLFNKPMKLESDVSNETTTEKESSEENEEKSNTERKCRRAGCGEIEIGSSQAGTKIWKIKNNLSYAWPAGSTLSYFGGDKLKCEKAYKLEKDLLPQEEIEIELKFVAPSNPGKYFSVYRFITPDNVPIGRRLRIFLNVKKIEELNKKQTPKEGSVVEDINDDNKLQSVEKNQHAKIRKLLHKRRAHNMMCKAT